MTVPFLFLFLLFCSACSPAVANDAKTKVSSAAGLQVPLSFLIELKVLKPALGIRILILMFMGLSDPDPDPLVRGSTDPDQDPSFFSYRF
jgi:hypothetical protein